MLLSPGFSLRIVALAIIGNNLALAGPISIHFIQANPTTLVTATTHNNDNLHLRDELGWDGHESTRTMKREPDGTVEPPDAAISDVPNWFDDFDPVFEPENPTSDLFDDCE